MGLHIVKEAINKVSGNISVESELAKGSIFAINIPNQKGLFLGKMSLEKVIYQL